MTLPLPSLCSQPRPDPEKLDPSELIEAVRTWHSHCVDTERDEFEVVEVLKGVPVRDLFLRLPKERFSIEDTFDNHSPQKFSPPAGRVVMQPDCRLYPSFETEATYLYLGPEPHWLGFERIDASDDWWLHLVRELIAAGG